jgi:hypothetical protein
MVSMVQSASSGRQSPENGTPGIGGSQSGIFPQPSHPALIAEAWKNIPPDNRRKSVYVAAATYLP